MSWIDEVGDEDAAGELRAVYDRIKGKRGKLSNIMTVQSLNPAAMAAHLDLYTALMFGSSGIARRERELIAVGVSVANRCAYCVEHHSEALRRYLKADTVRRVIEDYRSAGLPERAVAMLDYAVALTTEPSAMTEESLEHLRKTGFSDRDILDINLIASYFNFVNRIAVGLGVEFTPDEVAGYKSELTGG